MNMREACIKFGFQEPEFRELKRKGIIKEISRNQFDEKDVQDYFDQFWKKHITSLEIKDRAGILGTKFTALIKEGKLKMKGKYYCRKSFEDYINSDEGKTYIVNRDERIKKYGKTNTKTA
jgi:hypothetical protein